MADALYFSTKILAPFEGADGSTIFTNYGTLNGQLSTYAGAPTISTLQSKFGSSSLRFNGGNDSLSLNQLDVGAVDFTFEFWIWLTSFPLATAPLAGDPAINKGLFLKTDGTLMWDTAGFGNKCQSLPTTLGAWHHVAAARRGGLLKLFLNGVSSVTTYADPSSSLIFQQIGRSTASFVGFIADLRITIWAARYTDNFTPPGALDLEKPPVVPSLVANAIPLVQIGSQPVTLKAIATAILLRDTSHGGNGIITGTVKEAGTPDAPAKRRVRLHRKIDGLMVREVWSAADGTYAFRGIAIQPYYVTSFDHTGNYNAVIKDSITPEVMP